MALPFVQPDVLRQGLLRYVRQVDAAWTSGARKQPDEGPFAFELDGRVMPVEARMPTSWTPLPPEAWRFAANRCGKMTLPMVDWFAVLTNLLGHLHLWAADHPAEGRECFCPKAVVVELDRLFANARDGVPWSTENMVRRVQQLPVVYLASRPELEPWWLRRWKQAWAEGRSAAWCASTVQLVAMPSCRALRPPTDINGEGGGDGESKEPWDLDPSDLRGDSQDMRFSY